MRDSEQSLSSDRAAEDLTALVLVVFTTIILAGLDEDPDAILADGRTITSSSAYLFLAVLDADSTGVKLIAVLGRIAATHSRDYYQSGRQADRQGGDGSDDEIWMSQAPPPPPPPSLAHPPPPLPPPLRPHAPTVTATVVLIVASDGRHSRLPRTDVQ